MNHICFLNPKSSIRIKRHTVTTATTDFEGNGTFSDISPGIYYLYYFGTVGRTRKSQEDGKDTEERRVGDVRTGSGSDWVLRKS